MIIMANKSVAGFRDFSVLVSGIGVYGEGYWSMLCGGLICFSQLCDVLLV